MQSVFEQLVDSFLEGRVGIVENFLEPDLAARLRRNLLDLREENRLRDAGVGSNARLVEDKKRRRDKIFWLDRKHENPHENDFLDLVDDYVSFLNRTCYAGIAGYEFHYALYEPGAFYKRHLDQFKDNKRRAYTMITYLNEDWAEDHGGQLCVYHGEKEQHIAPTNGKCVFFKSSELEHEVLVSHQPRLSITGWFKTH
ncbi:2OG-Fe(II) oxygenase [Dyadobacter tibetensis]|uniref:2OG-Fe(II) oxygenase n=1 Tax=Dyadobacter tibetensis TaxID=1211851 RepID=UPI00047162F6|nr:2OG-Fe(II) oxygenase [Dyadobacter tibetensis]